MCVCCGWRGGGCANHFLFLGSSLKDRRSLLLFPQGWQEVLCAPTQVKQKRWMPQRGGWRERGIQGHLVPTGQKRCSCTESTSNQLPRDTQLLASSNQNVTGGLTYNPRALELGLGPLVTFYCSLAHVACSVPITGSLDSEARSRSRGPDLQL